MYDYFFSGKQYIRVTRDDSGRASWTWLSEDDFANWGWGSFGANGIDAGLTTSTSMSPSKPSMMSTHTDTRLCDSTYVEVGK